MNFLGRTVLMKNWRQYIHDDVTKWKHFPRYWPFVRGIHRAPVNSPHKGQWRGALMFSLICVWINGWVNNREAGDLRRYRAHYDVTVMFQMTINHHWFSLGWNVSTSPWYVKPLLEQKMAKFSLMPLYASPSTNEIHQSYLSRLCGNWLYFRLSLFQKYFLAYLKTRYCRNMCSQRIRSHALRVRAQPWCERHAHDAVECAHDVDAKAHRILGQVRLHALMRMLALHTTCVTK